VELLITFSTNLIVAAGTSLSIIIIAGNEEKMIGDCLKSCLFADEIVICHNSTDNTIKLAKQICPKVIIKENKLNHQKFDFSVARNIGFKETHSTWVLYLDSDERITPKLQTEIVKVINKTNSPITNYDIPRANYFLGQRVKYGGTYPDYVKRLFLKTSFFGFVGSLHEQPQVTGPGSVLKHDLLHFTHRDLTSMLEKSIKWTHTEAELLYHSGHPPVVWWRFPRMMFTKFWQRFICQSMWRDGLVGLISVIFEVFDTFIIYARLWEIQQAKS
jgi:glycosyltransferase involved in cell wall biosynthesis